MLFRYCTVRSATVFSEIFHLVTVLRTKAGQVHKSTLLLFIYLFTVYSTVYTGTGYPDTVPGYPVRTLSFTSRAIASYISYNIVPGNAVTRFIVSWTWHNYSGVAGEVHGLDSPRHPHTRSWGTPSHNSIHAALSLIVAGPDSASVSALA